MNRTDSKKLLHESSSSAEEVGRTPRGQNLAGARDSLRGFVDQKRLARVDDTQLKAFCDAVANDLDIKKISGFLSDAQKKLIADLFVKFFPSSSHSAPRVPRLRLPGQESAPTLPPATRTPRALVSARGLRASESTGSPRGLVKGQAAAIKQLKKGVLRGETDKEIDAFLTFARTCDVDLGDKQAVARLYQTWRARFDTGGAYIKGQTELMEAVERGDGKQVLNLLEHGVDPGVSQNWALNGKVIAEDYLDPNSKNYLVAGGLLDWVTRLVPTDQKGWGVGLSAVTLAVVVESDEPLAALARWIGANRLKRKHILGVGDAGGMTAVTRCVGEIGKREGQQRLNRLERLQLLLGLGAKINQPDENGETALTMAVKFHDRPLIRELLKAGAKICCDPSPIAAAFACEPSDCELALELMGLAGTEMRRLMHGPTGKCSDALAPLLACYGKNKEFDAELLSLLGEVAENAPAPEIYLIYQNAGWGKLPDLERARFDKAFLAREAEALEKAELRALKALVELRETHVSLQSEPSSQENWKRVQKAIADLPHIWARLAAKGLTPDLISSLSDILQSLHSLSQIAASNKNPIAPEFAQCMAEVWRNAYEKAAEEDRDRLLEAAKEPDLKMALSAVARNLLQDLYEILMEIPKPILGSRKLQRFAADLRSYGPQRYFDENRRIAKVFPMLAPLSLATANTDVIMLWNTLSTRKKASYLKSTGAAMNAFLNAGRK